MKPIYIYLLLVNALGFVLMLADKFKAQNKMRRTPEAVLIGVAALGGSLGCLAGMYGVRHKTNHLKFTICVPTLLIFHIFILLLLR